MKRFLLLLSLLCVMLSGCTAGVVTPPTGPVYNGEPTQLLVRLQRDDVHSPEFRSNTSDMAYVRVIKRDSRGTIVYQGHRAEPLPSDQTEIELPFEVPADQGYEIRGHSYRGEEFLGVIEPTIVDAPAKTLTTVAVPLVTPSYQLTKPDVMYSGGDLRQFILFPLPSAAMISSRLFLSFTPWEANLAFWNPDPSIRLFHHGEYLPTVTEPTKLYYQVALQESAQLPDGSHHCFRYYPNLSAGEEIPYIWVYPDPSWTD